VGNQLALPGTAEVVVKGLDRLLRVGDPRAVEIPQPSLLLGVDADVWIARV